MSTQKPDPIQQQLIDARRSQILDAAIAVFAEKGFHKATIKDVARAANVADGTIYNYFANKNALVLGILDRLNETEARGAHFILSADMDLRAFFRAYIHRRFDYLGPDGYSIFRVLIPEILTNPDLREMYYRQVIEPTFQRVEPFYQAWIDRGEIRPFNARLMLTTISSLFLGLITMRLIGDEYLIEHWDQIPDLITDILFNGLLPGDSHGD